MKKTYLQPVTDVVIVNLLNTILQGVHAGETSFRAGGEGGANTYTFEDDNDTPLLPTQESLWD